MTVNNGTTKMENARFVTTVTVYKVDLALLNQNQKRFKLIKANANTKIYNKLKIVKNVKTSQKIE
jgi:hypothetical protein